MFLSRIAPFVLVLAACGPSSLHNPGGGGGGGGGDGPVNPNDPDGDGFTRADGDCCETTSECTDPALVNPGAFDVPGNNVDDDCDGKVDEGATGCDTGLASNSSSAMDYAKAIELCETTTMAARTWGVIDAKFELADGTGSPDPKQHSIRPSFGSTTVRAGSSFAVLSTGVAAATGQSNPSFAAFQDGSSMGGSSGFPSDFFSAHGSTLPNAPGCPPADTIFSGANDPVMLDLTIRVPTNAKSFTMGVNFMSAEYPEWVCSPYNDFFVVLLDSTYAGTPANPMDKNLATYTSPSMQVYPVGVNLAYGNTGLFQQCKNGPTGCAQGSTAGNITTCKSTTELAGTGMDTLNPSGVMGGPNGYCGVNNQVGGGTGWLQTSGNVVGGEVIKLRIALWDTSDDILDSLAIIDNFQWQLGASDPGTVIE
jgi:hypothetical protein